MLAFEEEYEQTGDYRAAPSGNLGVRERSLPQRRPFLRGERRPPEAESCSGNSGLQWIMDRISCERLLSRVTDTTPGDHFSPEWGLM
jgi:hypothetical protein